MTGSTVDGRRPIHEIRVRRALVGLLAGVAVCATMPGWAATRLGGETDDSVCDVGHTQERSRAGSRAADFIRTQCQNGQLLMGMSVVPAGGFESEIRGLAKHYCRIADIQSRRFQENVGPLVMEFEDVRCRIEKLPK